jgi:hypothetical protein
MRGRLVWWTNGGTGDGVELEVPGYHLRSCLARGESTSVHRAEAIGHPGRILVVEHLATRPDPASLAAVRQVAEVLRALRHPNVLPLLDVVDTGTGIALVMPFAPAGSLAEAMDRSPAGLPPTMIADVGARIADGLAALHEHGVVHGDITARSVRFDARGRPLLADTGIDLLRDGVGSSHAPAGADGSQRSAARDAAGDLRALGSVLAAALVGRGAARGDLSAAGNTGARPTDDTAGSSTDGSASQPTEVPPAEPVEGDALRRAATSTLIAAIERALAAGTDERAVDARQLAAALARAYDEVVEAAASSGSETALLSNDRPDVARGNAPRIGGAVDATTDETTAPACGTTARALRAGRRARVAGVAAAGAILLVPFALVLTAVDDPPAGEPPQPVPRGADGAPPVPQAATDAAPPVHRDAGAPRDAGVAPPTPQAAAPRRPPTICTGFEAPPGDGTVLFADLDGRGCSTPMRWDGRELAVATAREAPRRYELLADDDDQLLFGDLSCDERDAPILYRPGTGEVFVFDGLVAPGEEITVAGEPFGRAGGRATVVTDDAGCDRLHVDRRP